MANPGLSSSPLARASSPRTRTTSPGMFATPQLDPPATVSAHGSDDRGYPPYEPRLNGTGHPGQYAAEEHEEGEEEHFIGAGSPRKGRRTSGQWGAARQGRGSGGGSNWLPTSPRHLKKSSDLPTHSAEWSGRRDDAGWTSRLFGGWGQGVGLPLPPTAAHFPGRRRKLMVIGGVALLFLFLYRRVVFPSRYSSNAAVLKRLTLDPRLDKGAIKARPLMSQTSPYGFISLIDPYAGGVFNPSLIALPDNVYLGARILMVARGPERFEVITGEDVRWQTVHGLFVIPMERKHIGLPYLARESDLFTLKLPARREVPFSRCEDRFRDQFVGAEDPKLFLTNDGQPLLIYSQNGLSPMICRAINIIDARVVMPGLKEEMDRAGWSPPVIFTNQTDLSRTEQLNIEKDWAPFLGDDDDLWFHVSLVPQLAYKYVANRTLNALVPDAPSFNCLTDLVAADARRVTFQHATPLLRVTMCKRGECQPSVDNTLLFGIIHVKYDPEPYLFYERRVVTWNITSPYQYLSVSKPLTYMGTNQADPVYTVSMAWNHPSRRNGLGLNHGFLGESVFITFGLYDYGSAYLEVLADDLLAEHSLCSPTFSLWGR